MLPRGQRSNVCVRELNLLLIGRTEAIIDVYCMQLKQDVSTGE